MTESCLWVMQCHLRARRPRASNKGLRPCPLRTEISPVSLNLLMMLCTVYDEIYKAFAIWHWGTLTLKTFHNLFYALFHRLESLCPSLLLRDSAFFFFLMLEGCRLISALPLFLHPHRVFIELHPVLRVQLLRLPSALLSRIKKNTCSSSSQILYQ